MTSPNPRLFATVITVLALAACDRQEAGGAAPPSDAALNGDAALAGDLSPAFDPATLPGLVLWLSPEQGVSVVDNTVESWTDRTSFRHVLLSDLGGALPPVGAWKGHPIPVFTGRNRLAVSNTPPPDAQAALEIGTSDFLVAVVASTKKRPTSRGGALVWGLTDRITSQGPTTVESKPSMFISVGEKVELLSPDWLLLPSDVGNFDDDHLRLYVLRAQGASLELRVNGTSVSKAPQGRADGSGKISSFPYRSPHIGGFDYDQLGTEGIVPETLMLKGQISDSMVGNIEAYLKAKYAL